MLYNCENVHGGDIYGEEVVLDFSANTNPFGTPQGVLDAVTQALSQVHHYPDPYCRKLVKAIAEHEEVPQNYILCGNGAAELIYAYCETLRPKRAVELAPTFLEYTLGLERVGCNVMRYKLKQKKEFMLDDGFLAFLEKSAPAVVFLCNPNNPTGKAIDPHFLEEILKYCRHKSIRLFIDECFLDLADRGESLKTCLKGNPHLFILKAFTKSYGMAGIRLGYCMSSDTRFLTRMSQAVQPWNVSILAQAAGVAALQEKNFLWKTRSMVLLQRQWLTEELEKMGYWVCPGNANYLLFRGPDDLHEKLKQKKIAIRNCSNYRGLGPGWYRIAVRLPDENQALIQAMKEV